MRLTRRTVLLGLGTITASGGAVFGSGAFSQTTANRSVTVQVAGDDAALVELTEVSENAGFVDSTGGTLELRLDGSGTASGSGFLYDAVIYLEPLFRIKNAGNQAVGVRIGSTPNTASNVSVGDYNIDGTTVRAFQYATTATSTMTFYACDTGTLSGDNDFSDSNQETLSGTNNGSIVQDTFGNANDLNLTVGASVEVGFVIDSSGASSSDISTDTDVLNEIEVVASADQA